jgi:predicted Fe-Mo cluster-binding NifX family protein
MIVAVCSSGDSPTSPMDSRFGRSPVFMLYNSESGVYRSVANGAKDSAGGAGSKALQQLLNEEVDVLIAGEIGPKAADALEEFELPVFMPPAESSGSELPAVEDVVELWRKGALPRWKKPEMRHFGNPS